MADLEEFLGDRVTELEQTARRLATALRKEKSRTESLVEAVYQAARDAALIAPKVKATKPKADKRKPRGEVALLHATDWQVGKHSDSYDTDVARARMRTLAEKVARIADIQRADHPVRECVLMLGGDMIEGASIFPTQAFEIDSTVYEQVFATAAITEQLVTDLLGSFEQVTVWDIHGNHGRIGRRGDLPSLDNLDRILYRIARDRMSDKRLTWHHAQTWHQIVNVGEYNALLVHGDQIRSFGGNLPLYGIVKKVSSWKSGVLPKFFDAFIGHFHQHNTVSLAGGGHVYMTGSPESGNEYAAEFIAATGTPSQRLHFVDPEAGRTTAEYRVYLDDH